MQASYFNCFHSKIYFVSSLIVASLLAILFEAKAEALDLKPSEIRSKTTEKPVAVLQKRFFRKKWRPEIGVIAGALLNEAYTKTEKRGLRLGLFGSEWVGAELQYIDTSVTSSEDRKALEQLKFKKAEPKEGEDPDNLVSPEPEVNKVHQIMDLNLIFAPFYGKVNLLDTMIVYMDTYLVAGGSALKTDQGNKNAIVVGIGQRYYMFRSFSFRVDFRNHSFTETRAGKSSRRNQQSWDLGIGWFFL